MPKHNNNSKNMFTKYVKDKGFNLTKSHSIYQNDFMKYW